MAAGNDMPSDVNADFTAHAASYSRFTGMMKWGAVACLIIALFVVFVLLR